MEDENNNQAPANFFDDEPQEGVSYIQPNIDIQLPAAKRKECRNIVMEIRKFGVSQRQLLYLIDLLALELENRDVMLALRKAIGDNRDKVKISGLILPDQEE